MTAIVRTKADGDALISERKLANASVTDKAGARRSIRWDNPNGPGTIEVEFDASPSDQQLLELEMNLPPAPSKDGQAVTKEKP